MSENIAKFITKTNFLPNKSALNNNTTLYEQLEEQTGFSKAEIKVLHDKFNVNSKDGKLNRESFIHFYASLRHESLEALKGISLHIFRVFNKKGEDSITFEDFVLAYAITNKGDLRKRLEMTFNLYDIDRNGYLDSNEITIVIESMLVFLGANNEKNSPERMTKSIIKELDISKDQKISKEEFINGLLRKPNIRALMSPFS